MTSSSGKVPPAKRHSSIVDGVRAGLPLALPTFAIGASFGVLAEPVIGAAPAIVMSILIYSGAGQFAALTVLAGGGGALAAIAALLMMNARWLPMGFAIGPSLSGGRARRFLDAQAIVDASFAISSRGDGSFDRRLLIGATLPQVSSWMAGTVAGVVIGADLGEPETLGLDAIFPAFYLALLVEEARGSTAIAAAGAGAVIAAALIPVAPAGISILAASLAALIGLRAR